MKQKVQLFIDNQEVDVFDSGSINIVSSIKDLRDPAKLFADFSRNFSLPATPRNNKIFKHYYNYDIIDGFDARQSKEARIEINNRPYKTGYVILDGVDLKYNKPSNYRITFFGNLRFLKEVFGKLELSSLDWLDDFKFTYRAYDSSQDSVWHYLTSTKNHLASNAFLLGTGNGTKKTFTLTYSPYPNTTSDFKVYINDVEESTSNYTYSSVTGVITFNTAPSTGESVTVRAYYTQPLVVPLISNKERLYYNSNSNFYSQLKDGNLHYDVNYSSNAVASGLEWTSLRPAIRVDLILRAIEQKVNNDRTLPYDIKFSQDFFNSANIDYYNLYMWLNKDVDESDARVETLIDTFPVSSTASYLYSGNTQSPLLKVDFMNKDGVDSGSVASQVKISEIEANYVDEVLVRLKLVSSDTTTTFGLQVNRNGVKYTSFSGETQTGTNSYLDFSTELDGVYEFIIITTENAPITFDSGFEIEIIPRVERDYNISTVTKGGGPKTAATLKEFLPSLNMPDMKILDFLSGLFKMFNLVAEVEDTSPTLKTIVVKTLDGFYNSSNVSLDITNKVDTTSAKVDKPLNYTRIEFKYEDTDAILAKQHKDELSAEHWGAEKWEISDAQSGETYEVIPPFAHMKYERLIDNETDTLTDLQVGYSITRGSKDKDDFKEQKYNPHYGKPLLFYPIKLTNRTIIPYVYNYTKSGFNFIATDDYFVPSNSTAFNLSQTNHFGLELSEYLGSSAGGDYTDNLFNTYWKNYISSIFNKKNRFIKVKAHFTNAFIAKFSLADKIVISGRDYSINKINLDIVSGKADLELIPYYAVKSYYCLANLFTVRVNPLSSGYLYVFDNKYGVYQIAEGTYTLEDIPSSHPIAFHNYGKENNITYTGTDSAGSKTALDGNTYEYFYGDVELTVNGDFGTISYECYNHGYMGGENNLVYNSACSVAPTPTPVTGTLTVDATDISVDSALITADQTDE